MREEDIMRSAEQHSADLVEMTVVPVEEELTEEALGVLDAGLNVLRRAAVLAIRAFVREGFKRLLRGQHEN
jgi:hypothetical protein